MTCEEFLRLLDDEAPMTVGDAAAHLAGCPACQRALERAQEVRRELRAMREEPPPPFLHARLMAHLAADRAARRPWWNVAVRPAWASAAIVVLLLVAVSGYRLYEWLRPSPVEPPVQVALRQELPPPPVPELRASDARSPVTPVAAPPSLRKQAGAAAAQQRKAQTGHATAPAFAPAPTEAPAPGVGGTVPGAAAPALEGAAGVVGTSQQAASDSTAKMAEQVTVTGGTASATAALRSKSAQGRAATSYAVVCELRFGAAVVARPLLPGSATPWGDTVWQVEVQPDGSVAVRDAAGTRIARAEATIKTVIASLHLPAGRYTLTRFRP